MLLITAFYRNTFKNLFQLNISQLHSKYQKQQIVSGFLLKSRGSPNYKARARYRSSHNRSERLSITCRAARIIIKHFTSNLLYFSKPQPTKAEALTFHWYIFRQQNFWCLFNLFYIQFNTHFLLHIDQNMKIKCSRSAY